MSVRLFLAATVLAVNLSRTATGIPGDGLRRVPDVILGPPCHKIEAPGKMPAVNTLVDSVVLMAGIATLDWGTANDITVSVRMADTAAAHAMGQASETPAGVSLATIVVSSLRAKSADAPEAFRIRFRKNKGVELRVEKAELCEPTFEGQSATQMNNQKIAFTVTRVITLGQPGASSPATLTGPRTNGTAPPTVRLHINKLGYAVEIEFVKGTGSVASDEAFKDSVAKRHYTPALLDGEPVDVWVEGDKVTLVK